MLSRGLVMHALATLHACWPPRSTTYIGSSTKYCTRHCSQALDVPADSVAILCPIAGAGLSKGSNTCTGHSLLISTCVRAVVRQVLPDEKNAGPLKRLPGLRAAYRFLGAVSSRHGHGVALRLRNISSDAAHRTEMLSSLYANEWQAAWPPTSGGAAGLLGERRPTRRARMRVRSVLVHSAACACCHETLLTTRCSAHAACGH